MSTKLKAAKFIYDRLTEQFRPDKCTDVFKTVGVQVHNTDVIAKVYTATFASPEVFDNILARNEENVMLFTHHPLPPMPSLQEGYGNIPEKYFTKMQEQKMNFFSFHIPLDVAGPYSPGNTLSTAMGTNPYASWYPQNGAMLGALCQSKYATLTELHHCLTSTIGHKASMYHYGEEQLLNGKFAIMAGIGKSIEAYEFLEHNKINTLVVGVTAPTVDWSIKIHAAAKEHHINLLGGTHYSTEKFALMSMLPFFNNLGVEAEFIPEQPNLAEL